ncbi:6891_t:CDS:1, partial [Acaulospora morrowiae]
MLLEVLFLVTLGGKVYGIGDTDSPESASNATGIPKLDDPSYY